MKIWDNGASEWTDTFVDGDPIDAATGEDAYKPQIVVDSGGRVYIPYYQSDGEDLRVYLSRYDGTDVKIWCAHVLTFKRVETVTKGFRVRDY